MARPPNPNPGSVTSEVLPVRLTPAEREGVNELVRRQIAALHSTGAGVTAGSVVRGLIRRELLAQLIEGPIVPPAAPIQQSLFTAPTAATSAPIVEVAAVGEVAPIVEVVPVVEAAAIVEATPTDTASASPPEPGSFRTLLPLQERRAIVAELTQMLGDPVTRPSQAWWHYLGAVNELGPDVLRELAREALRIEDEGGMWTKDNSRRRTPGGVFFALFTKRIGYRRDKAIHYGAQRSFERDMIERFLKFLALVLPATEAETGSASPVEAPGLPSPAAPAQNAAAMAVPLPTPAPPSRRPRPMPALPEVIVVRRRVAPREVVPVVETAPAARTAPAKPAKASTSKARTAPAKPAKASTSSPAKPRR